MPVGFGAGIRLPTNYNPLCDQRFKLFRPPTLEMGTQAPGKRPFCPSCLKPARLCLCIRLKNPSLENSISVTILQHSQERKHPLNSTRIATLGLKNLTVAMVSDVHIEARFTIRLLKSDSENVSVAAMEGKSDLCRFQNNRSEKSDINRILETLAPQDSLVEEDLESSVLVSNLRKGSEEKSDFEQLLVWNSQNYSEKTDILQNSASTINQNNGRSAVVALEIPQNNLKKHHMSGLVTMPPLNGAVSDCQIAINQQTQLPKSNSCEEEPIITATIAKCGFICSLTQLQSPSTELKNPDFDQLLASQIGQSAVSNGFVVKKLQKKELNGITKYEECEEFEVVIPPGSALLFPTKKSVGLAAVDLEVKHLIVLDGTWAKAKRMYHENPWLKLLPHLKLDPSKTSLYDEVRHQPKAGCLSTIESIVCAMKGLGDNSEGLDDLLDVFESMVRDQRRCKDERLSKISSE